MSSALCWSPWQVGFKTAASGVLVGMEQGVHKVRVAKSPGALFPAFVVWTATTFIAKVFFCGRGQSFVLGLCRMFSLRPDFSGYTPQPIAFNITIILLLCSVLQGINEDDDTEMPVINYFGFCVLVAVGNFQARPQNGSMVWKRHVAC